MAKGRRKPYTKLIKHNRIRANHVKGKGDKVYLGFQCLKADCRNFIFVRENLIGPVFKVTCGKCGFIFRSGDSSKFFDYELVYKEDNRLIREGEFRVLHDDYIGEASKFKYCVLCNSMKPLDAFDKHSSRSSGRQSECNLCKQLYNTIKNDTRITDQHREASDRRRTYRLLADEMERIDSHTVFDRFGGQCFNCGVDLEFKARGKKGYDLDHTLPASYLWPITTSNATLLCNKKHNNCNGSKSGKWPSEFYSTDKIKELATLTGYSFKLLNGNPQLNPKAVEALLEDPDTFIREWIHKPDEIKKVRDLVLEHKEVDLFEIADQVPDYLREA